MKQELNLGELLKGSGCFDSVSEALNVYFSEEREKYKAESKIKGFEGRMPSMDSDRYSEEAEELEDERKRVPLGELNIKSNGDAEEYDRVKLYLDEEDYVNLIVEYSSNGLIVPLAQANEFPDSPRDSCDRLPLARSPVIKSMEDAQHFFDGSRTIKNGRKGHEVTDLAKLCDLYSYGSITPLYGNILFGNVEASKLEEVFEISKAPGHEGSSDNLFGYHLFLAAMLERNLDIDEEDVYEIRIKFLDAVRDFYESWMEGSHKLDLEADVAKKMSDSLYYFEQVGFDLEELYETMIGEREPTKTMEKNLEEEYLRFVEFESDKVREGLKILDENSEDEIEALTELLRTDSSNLGTLL